MLVEAKLSILDVNKFWVQVEIPFSVPLISLVSLLQVWGSHLHVLIALIADFGNLGVGLSFLAWVAS